MHGSVLLQLLLLHRLFFINQARVYVSNEVTLLTPSLYLYHCLSVVVRCSCYGRHTSKMGLFKMLTIKNWS